MITGDIGAVACLDLACGRLRWELSGPGSPDTLLTYGMGLAPRRWRCCPSAAQHGLPGRGEPEVPGLGLTALRLADAGPAWTDPPGTPPPSSSLAPIGNSDALVLRTATPSLERLDLATGGCAGAPRCTDAIPPPRRWSPTRPARVRQLPAPRRRRGLRYHAIRRVGRSMVFGFGVCWRGRREASGVASPWWAHHRHGQVSLLFSCSVRHPPGQFSGADPAWQGGGESSCLAEGHPPQPDLRGLRRRLIRRRLSGGDRLRQPFGINHGHRDEQRDQAHSSPIASSAAACRARAWSWACGELRRHRPCCGGGHAQMRRPEWVPAPIALPNRPSESACYDFAGLRPGGRNFVLTVSPRPVALPQEPDPARTMIATGV